MEFIQALVMLILAIGFNGGQFPTDASKVYDEEACLVAIMSTVVLSSLRRELSSIRYTKMPQVRLIPLPINHKLKS